eukprot:Tamp_26108.p3 GENE.Tamp_26108~~Tamp_26108.p3  ORF type:complete len:141 (+),score=10.70 Tamp_26108:446-868(+)
MHACERLQLRGGETAADEPRGWATSPNFRVASRRLGCLPPPPPGPAPEAETGDEVTRGGGGCEINTRGWTSSPNFRVACRLLEHGAASRGAPGPGCLGIVAISRTRAAAADGATDLGGPPGGWRGNDAFRTAARCVYDAA